MGISAVEVCQLGHLCKWGDFFFSAPTSPFNQTDGLSAPPLNTPKHLPKTDQNSLKIFWLYQSFWLIFTVFIWRIAYSLIQLQCIKRDRFTLLVHLTVLEDPEEQMFQCHSRQHKVKVYSIRYSWIFKDVIDWMQAVSDKIKICQYTYIYMINAHFLTWCWALISI